MGETSAFDPHPPNFYQAPRPGAPILGTKRPVRSAYAR